MTNERLRRLSPAARIRHYASMERFYLHGNNPEAAAKARQAAHRIRTAQTASK